MGGDIVAKAFDLMLIGWPTLHHVTNCPLYTSLVVDILARTAADLAGNNPDFVKKMKGC
jgi:hypothetical protein